MKTDRLFGNTGSSLRQIWSRKEQQRNIRFRVQIRLLGKGGHSSVPYKTHNPIIAGNELMQILMDKVWFEFDSFDDIILVPIEMESGSRHNVIPDEAVLVYYGECRGDEAYRHLQTIMKESLQAAELAYKVRYKVSFYRLDPEGLKARAAKARDAKRRDSADGRKPATDQTADPASDQAYDPGADSGIGLNEGTDFGSESVSSSVSELGSDAGERPTAGNDPDPKPADAPADENTANTNDNEANGNEANENAAKGGRA